MPEPAPSRIVSWNLNGIRAAHRQGFGAWLAAERDRGAVFVGLQEVRAQPSEVPAELAGVPGLWSAFVGAERKGYSGVGAYAPFTPDDVVTSLGVPELDREARYLEVRFGEATLVSAYFPNGNGALLPNGKRSNDRIPFKLDFYRAVAARHAPALARGERVVVMGDFNTAHREIDLARPRENRETSGFTDVERAELDVWLAAGWVDSFRHLHPDTPDAYSWWSQRFGVRARNVGWRIDLVMVSPAVVPTLREAFIDAHVGGSDHCPVGIAVDAQAFFGRPLTLATQPEPTAPRATSRRRAETTPSPATTRPRRRGANPESSG
jgi:exodeoxyribonuclease-3